MEFTKVARALVSERVLAQADTETMARATPATSNTLTSLFMLNTSFK